MDRGCVEDQPQHVGKCNPLRLVEDDTAAVRMRRAFGIYKRPSARDNSAPTHGPPAQPVHQSVPDLGPARWSAGALVSTRVPVVQVLLYLMGPGGNHARHGSDVERGGFPAGAGNAAR